MHCSQNFLLRREIPQTCHFLRRANAFKSWPYPYTFPRPTVPFLLISTCSTGAYPRTGNAAFKEEQAALKAASKKALTAAKKGDKAAANAAIKEYIAIGKITINDKDFFNPKQRRNPGAPPTAEIEAQMGTQAFALYDPVKSK